MARQSENGCSLEEAARSLGVSRRTICRDIYELAMIGVAIRISGDRVVCEGGEYQVEADAVAMRRLAILSLLASGPRTLSDITAYVCDERRGFDVDERTVRRDIEHMVSAGYVVERADEAEGPKSYALSELFMPRFSLPFSQLAAVMRALDTSPAALADPVTAASIKGKLMAALMPDPSPVDRVCRRRHIVGRARIASSSMLSKVDALELAAMEGRVVEMVYRGPKAQGSQSTRPGPWSPLASCTTGSTTHGTWWRGAARQATCGTSASIAYRALPSQMNSSSPPAASRWRITCRGRGACTGGAGADQGEVLRRVQRHRQGEG